MSSWRLKVYIFTLGSLVVGAGLLPVMVLTTVPCLTSNPPKHPQQHPSRPVCLRQRPKRQPDPSAAQIAKEKKSIVKDINPPEHPTAREPPNDRGAKL